MYVILHGFSRRNAGDGLLVDLTLDVLESVGIDRSDCALLALDPESFGDLDCVYQAPGEPGARPSLRLGAAGLEFITDALTGGRLGAVGRLVRNARGLIAVGGGYLVADSPVRQLGMIFNHMAQLSAAARSRVPTIYMPQSIGPLNGPIGRMVIRRLRQIDRVYVRDDRTLSEVGGTNLRRCGDLAVLKLARELENAMSRGPGDRSAIVVARDLPMAGDYVKRLRSLAAGLTHPLWAVQADVKGPRSDRMFYEKHGIESAGSLSGLLNTRTPGVVVSVRLHGAIAALIAGCPAIHLAYERKGWGAYEDLGVAAYVHDARTFDPGLVIAQARELQENPEPFWALIKAAAPALNTQYDELVADLRSRLAS